MLKGDDSPPNPSLARWYNESRHSMSYTMIALASRFDDMDIHHPPTGESTGTAAKPPRNPAQALAARLNGSKSQGPRTDAGKQKSAMNSLKHGLLAKRIAPPADNRGEHADYENQLAELLIEFDPITRTELNLVELLAADWVRVSRIRQHTESVLDTGPLTRSDPVRSLEAAEKDLAIIEQLAACCESKQPFCADDGDVSGAATLIRKTTQSLCEIEKILRDGGTYTEDSQLLRRIRVGKLRILTPGVAEAVLADPQQLSADDRERWGLLLQRLMTGRRGMVAAAEQDQISHERACRQHQGRLSDKLPELERLANYEHRFMRQIQRNTDLLNELQCRRRNRDLIPGSFSENIFSRG